jgi:hypothetical protein
MRINLVTSFAAGILIATSITGVVYISDSSHVSKAADKTVKQNLSDSEMKDKLSSAGYVVQTKADYDKALSNAKAAAKKAEPADSKPASKVVNQVVINVAMGMTSIDIGRTLQSAKLIPSAVKFQMDVHKRGVEKNLRPGTFVINSSMTYDQIIATIFKKK